jgi:hypothetical protein
MKKLNFLLIASAMFAFVACGPSAEEIAEKEKAVQDSIAAVEAAKEQAIADSMAVVEAAAQAAKEQAIADSIAAATEVKGKKK